MNRRTLLAVGALVAVAAATAVALTLPARDPAAPDLRRGELSAEGLVDSIGVNVHFSYVDTSYVRRAEALARLRELGIRHLRDAVPTVAVPLTEALLEAVRLGFKLTLITDVNRNPDADVARSVELLGDGIAAFEAPNELDNSGDPAWASKLTEFIPELADAVRRRAPGVPLIGASLLDPAARAELAAALPGAFNGHPYAGGGPPEPALAVAVREGRAGAPKQPIYFTETGYHNALTATTGQPPVSEQAAAVYLPRALVAAYGAGVRRTFVYELLDEKPDPEQHFGLLRQDLSPKPAFTAIATMIRVLRASPGEGEGALAWRVGGDEQVERLTLVRRDGSRVLALWRPVSVWDQDARNPLDPGTSAAELVLSRPAHDVTVWRPSVSASPVLRRARAQRLRLELGADLILVSLR